MRSCLKGDCPEGIHRGRMHAIKQSASPSPLWHPAQHEGQGLPLNSGQTLCSRFPVPTHGGSRYIVTQENQIIYQNQTTLKGVSKAVVKNEITYQDYVKVHKDNIPIKRNVTSIRSFNHNVVTFRTEKIALTSYYDKMKMIDGNTCLPFGYNPTK